MSLEKKIKIIDTLKEQIDAHGKFSDELLQRINYRFRLDLNFYSNSIEGNTLTRFETKSVMTGNITIEGKPLKDLLEMKKHDQVVQDILQMGRGELNLSEKRIKEVHAAIMYEEDAEKIKLLGKWKPYTNEVITYRGEKYEFTSPDEVPEEMHKLVNWLNVESDKIKKGRKDALHPAIVAFEFHLRYVTIHPFYDGNGRTARLFMNIILVAFGYPPVVVKESDKANYNQYLADVQCYEGNREVFYNLMLSLLERSLLLVKTAMEGGSIEHEDDLDKEIKLFISDIKNENAVTERNTHQNVFRVIEHVFIPLVKRLRSELKIFDELFNEGKMMVLLTTNGKEMSFHLISPDFVSAQDSELWEFVKRMKDESGNSPYRVEIVVGLKGFKYNKNNPGSVDVSLPLHFDEYNYWFNKKNYSSLSPQIVKLYTEDLDENEQSSLIQDCKRYLFDRVKTFRD